MARTLAFTEEAATFSDSEEFRVLKDVLPAALSRFQQVADIGHGATCGDR